jgi:hypothetical protein
MTREQAVQLISETVGGIYRLANGSEIIGVTCSSFGRKLDYVDLKNLGFKVFQGQMVKGSGKLARMCMIVEKYQ